MDLTLRGRRKRSSLRSVVAAHPPLRLNKQTVPPRLSPSFPPPSPAFHRSALISEERVSPNASQFFSLRGISRDQAAVKNNLFHLKCSISFAV